MEGIEVRKFLSTLSDEDFAYVNIQLSMAKDAKRMIQEFDLTKEKFTELMKFKSKTDCDKYLNGGFNYTIMHMAKIQTIWIELRMEQAVKEAEEKLTRVKTDYTTK